VGSRDKAYAMRKLLEDTLSQEERDELLALPGCKSRFDKDTPPIIAGLLEQLREHAPIKADGLSYYKIEALSSGHGWHYDGCKRDKTTPNHMPWCQWSAVTLLAEPTAFTGGVLEFRDPDESYEPEDLYCNTVLYSASPRNDKLRGPQGTPDVYGLTC